MKERIKDLRSVLNFSQKDFAASIGVKQSSVSMMERGTIPVTDRVITTICLAHGVDEHWLRTGEGDMFPPLPEEDDELIEALGMITDDSVDPVRKKLASACVRLLLEIPEDAIPAIRTFVQSASRALDKKEKDED